MKKIGIEIFGRIWFLWFFVTFFFILMVCYPFVILISRKHTHRNVLYVLFFYRICIYFSCILNGFRIHIVGKENYQRNQKYIIVANHRSLMDIPIFAAYFPARIIAKNSFFTKIPILATYYKVGAVLVNRKSRISRSQSFVEMKEVLSKNISMAIYPEGTRNRSNQPVLNFHNGAFRLAKETGVSILPIVLFNTDKAISTNKPFFAMPTKIDVHILASVNPNDFLTMEALRDEVQQRIKMEYENYNEKLSKKNLFWI